MISQTITPADASSARAGLRLWPAAGAGTAGSWLDGSGFAVSAHDRAAGTHVVRTVPMSARVDFRIAKPARPPRGVPR
jgi:hypothetical protein